MRVYEVIAQMSKKKIDEMRLMVGIYRIIFQYTHFWLGLLRDYTPVSVKRVRRMMRERKEPRSADGRFNSCMLVGPIRTGAGPHVACSGLFVELGNAARQRPEVTLPQSGGVYFVHLQSLR